MHLLVTTFYEMCFEKCCEKNTILQNFGFVMIVSDIKRNIYERTVYEYLEVNRKNSIFKKHA